MLSRATRSTVHTVIDRSRTVERHFVPKLTNVCSHLWQLSVLPYEGGELAVRTGLTIGPDARPSRA
ncbi:hypothetical protein QFZ43_000296 [Streptomyces afghaniensis]|nr:hypothetical protein [Streptomyces afghaniensis]